MARRLAFVLSVLIPVAVSAADFPSVETFERQPLLSQTTRLAEALEAIGNPLSAEATAEIERLKALDDDAAVAAGVQKLLDPLCVVAVELDGTATKVTPAPQPVSLIEQGWRAGLVKVVNRAGVTGRLRVESPNARSVPNAPAEAVAGRWLGLEVYDGQPLRPGLSGLPLEYRVLQFYSRDVGERTARLDVSVTATTGRETAVVKEWQFNGGAAGWEAKNDVKLSVEGGALRAVPTGEDPYLAAAVSAEPGEYVLRFWGAGKGGVGQVFWWTGEQPQTDGARQVVVNYSDSPAGAVQEAKFRSEGRLGGVRIDLDPRSGPVRIDWVELVAADASAGGIASTDVAFEAVPSVPVTFAVTDLGQPAVAAFEIRDKLGRVYPLQSKRLAPDFFFQKQVYRGTGESVNLPAGTYTVVCSRGPETVPETKTVEVGSEPVTVRYDAKRWIDTAALGYWSGDHHIHAAGCLHYTNPTEGVHPEDMLRHCKGEDLKVGCCLTWGPCFDYQKRFFTGKPDDVSEYPYLLRYDIEVSGFGSHNSGHLNLLRLREQIYPGGESKDHWPTLGLNTLAWAKRQGAVCGPAHSAAGLTRTVGRLEGADGLDGPNRLPNFEIPAYDGIGANEFVVDITHEVPGPDGKPLPAVDFISTMNTDRVAEWNMWYHALNCGFRTKASGETDFPCITGERVGLGRVYAKLDGKLEFDRWVDAIADGRCYVSDGSCHLMEFTAEPAGDEGKRVELGVNGSELKLDAAGEVTVHVRAAAYPDGAPSLPVELIVNGYAVAKQQIKADGEVRELTFEAELDRSSWLAVRAFPHAHTNPIWAVVGGKPVRPSRESVEWCLRGVEQCWSQKARTYRGDEKAAAEKAYEHAREVYGKLLAEALPAKRP